MANITGDRATRIALRVFEHIRKSIKWDAEMMELIVCGNIIRKELPMADTLKWHVFYVPTCVYREAMELAEATGCLRLESSWIVSR